MIFEGYDSVMVECKLFILFGHPTVLIAVKLSYNYNVTCYAKILLEYPKLFIDYIHKTDDNLSKSKE